MVAITGMYSGFAVRDIAEAKAFYKDTLGLAVTDGDMGMIRLTLPQGGVIIVYPKPDHVPATYTILNLQVADIEVAVDALIAAGITLEKYPEMPWQDDKGIARGKAENMGPDIAWFLDPSGNILSVLSD